MHISKTITGTSIVKPDSNNLAKDIKNNPKIEKSIHDSTTLSALEKKSISKEGSSLKSLDFVSENNIIIDKELFPNGIKSINSTNVIQGNRSDCYLLSAIASLADKRPEEIMKMIKSNGNNTYTVTFAGIKNGTVTIEKPTNAELDKYVSRGTDSSIWAAVIEKAYMKLDVAGGVGGTVGSGINIITGHVTDADTLALTSKDETRSKLKEATKENKIITAAVSVIGDKKNNVFSRHNYSVLSYDEKSDTVKIRNPWGERDFKNIKNPDNKDDGVVTLTMDEFNEKFTFIAYEKSENTKKNNILKLVF